MYDLITEFLNFLETALKNVDEKYWNVHSAEGEDFIRERVFCYELYHEMRKLQENEKGRREYHTFSNIDLYAEPDKRGWEKLEDDEKKNPDFIFHKKAESNNLIVMEVKGKKEGNIEKDAMTIAKNRIRRINIAPGYGERILVITQENPQGKMQCKMLKDILEEHQNGNSNL